MNSMKHLLFLFFLTVLAVWVQAQTNPYLTDSIIKNERGKLNFIKIKVEKYRDSMRTEISNQNFDRNYFYSQAAYAYYINKTFTLLNFEGLNFNNGNAASLKFEDGDTRLNLNVSAKSSTRIFTVGTALNVTDKSGVIFSGTKPTSGTEFSINFSQLIPNNKLGFYESVKKTIPYLRTNTLDSIVNLHAIQNPAQYDTAIAKLKEVETKLVVNRQKYDSLIVRIDSFKNQTPGLATIQQAKDRLQRVSEEYITLNAEKQKAVAALKLLQSVNSKVVEANRIIDSAKAADMYTMLNAGGIESTSLQWLSMGLSYKRLSYKTYNSNEVFDKRIGTNDFNNWRFNLGYNYYWGRSKQDLDRDKTTGSSIITSNYLNIAYSLATTNTYDELDEENINVIRQSSSNDTIYQLISSSKNRNITGVDYEKRIKHSVGIQWATSFGKAQFLGTNIIYTNDFSHGLKPVFNAHAGLLFHFKSVEDEKTKVNFEIFLSLKDMSDIRDKGGSVWKRKEIGVAATVPFSKVFFN
jgi:hypothetical protein